MADNTVTSFRTARNPNPAAMIASVTRVTEFWMTVDRREADECWIWTGGVDRNGYGVFHFEGRNRPAHELALTFSTGEIRHKSLDTCHECANPPCCNPGHLRFDTRSSNVQDMLRHGNHNPRRKLSDEEMRLILERRSLGARQQDLADQFGVCASTISKIVNGKVGFLSNAG